MFQLLKTTNTDFNFFSFLPSMFSLKFTYWKEKKTTPQNEKRDCKRKGISLGDTWYYTCPCEIKNKPQKTVSSISTKAS